MKKELAEKWAAALTSGEYKQTQHLLTADNKFCCLGVLCDITLEETGGAWGAETYSLSRAAKPFIFNKVKNIYGFGEDLCEKLGLSMEEVNELADMNDGGSSFAEIAARVLEMGQ